MGQYFRFLAPAKRFAPNALLQGRIMPGIETLAAPRQMTSMAPAAPVPAASGVPPQIAQHLEKTFGGMQPQEEMQFAQLAQQLDQFRPEELQALLQILMYLRENKARYAQAVQELVAQGKIQPDDVPSQYEPVFFNTMINAVQKRMQGGQQGAPMPEPAAFAQGGLASLAQTMSAAGRNGDNMLAHITPTEARYLNRVSGPPTINPVTGLPEYSLFGSIGSFLKSAATVILPIALSATPLGPIAGAALGSGIASMINGGKPADALKAGLIGGATGAVLSGISGMLPADSAFKPFLPDVGAASGQGFMAGIQAGLPSGLGLSGNYAMERGFPQWMGGSGTKPMFPAAGASAAGETVPSPGTLYDNDVVQQGPLGADRSASVAAGTSETTPSTQLVQTTPSATAVPSSGEAASKPITSYLFPGSPSTSDVLASADYKSAVAAGMSPDKAFQVVSAKMEPSFLAKYGPTAALGIGAMALAGGFKTPKVQQPNVPQAADFQGPTAQQLLAANPEKYGVGNLNPYQYVQKNPNFSATSEVVASPSYTQMAAQRPVAQVPNLVDYYYGRQPVRAAEGGVMSAAAYKRAHGHLRGPGTGTSDSIPAKLSDGEFVMTAKAVRGAGNGDRMAGAKKMYQLMRELEKRG